MDARSRHFAVLTIGFTISLFAAVGTGAASGDQAGGAGTASLATAPGQGVWRNYDFVPGATVWRATDFSGEPVGRFPGSQVEFVRGNMQVVEIGGEKALEVSGTSVFRIPLPQTLPAGFTVEFMINMPAPNFVTSIYFSPLTTAIARYDYDYVQIYGRPGIYRQGREVSNMNMPGIQDRWMPVKLQVDDKYAILYLGSERAAQVPVANFARGKAIEVHAAGNMRLKTYLKDFIVAVGLEKLYDTLITAGSFTTRGILFDTGSDRFRPESTPALAEITTTLRDHADLRIAIEGHTDDVGEAAANQALSERRARAVVTYLTQQGIAGARLSAEGKGESTPSVPNTTAEGRQQNRRVVIRVAK